MPRVLAQDADLMESISAVVMAYNEVRTLEAATVELEAALEETGREYEILVIDDGGSDGTAELADRLSQQRARLRVFHHERNRGMGGVYRTAFEQVRNDIVYFMAADLQAIPARYFPSFLPLFEEFDIVVGREPRREAPLLSRFFSGCEKQLFRLLFPGVPKIEGPLMFRRKILDQVRLVLMSSEDRSWMILWELMVRARRQGFRFARVRVRRRPRAHGHSRGSTWANAWHMTRRALVAWWILRR